MPIPQARHKQWQTLAEAVSQLKETTIADGGKVTDARRTLVVHLAYSCLLEIFADSVMQDGYYNLVLESSPHPGCEQLYNETKATVEDLAALLKGGHQPPVVDSSSHIKGCS